MEALGRPEVLLARVRVGEPAAVEPIRHRGGWPMTRDRLDRWVADWERRHEASIWWLVLGWVCLAAGVAMMLLSAAEAQGWK